MQHSAIRNKNETVTIFARTRNTSDECLVSKLFSDGSFHSINYTPNIHNLGDDLYSTDITLPNEDCIVYILFKKQPIVIIVGSPSKSFLYYRVNTGQNIPYNIVSDSGDAISSGTMNELSNGFYFVDVSEHNGSIITVDNKSFPIRFPYSGAGALYGTIKIQNNTWQLISIPRNNANVKEYFVDRLANKYGANAEDIIDICTAYFGNENKFRSYIPGITNPSTSNNFPLVYSDGSSREITGFWVKTKDMTGIVSDIDNIIFEWSSI